ncbi:GSCFA domain-containing protein [uncultured Bacteroides sp.]|uniref:GSCFA domain-containing protein n=1 Tax=uncultured Bacteroides sp. TaxID=162156 RepID=UPI002AAAD1CE|nr:GSCFA domain-containing protein [uncultured Bacteroides sp.]
MEFRTLVELPKKELAITYSDKILLLGSCFAQNIGNLLVTNKFNCTVNPFGVLYNPLSIANGLHCLDSKRTFAEKDLFEYKGLYHSFMHHGSFSASSQYECLENINSCLEPAVRQFPELNYLLITFGTAYVYDYKQTGTAVANCHKLPESAFNRRLLSVEQIMDVYIPLIDGMLKNNHNLKLLFSVSPIRHVKDGMHGNQLSKAILLLAIDALKEHFPQHVFYFPSYELVVDELRDYRFYADDMLHPSAVAVTYLWESFGNCYFSKETKQIMKEWGVISKALQHKPFHPGSEQHKLFLSQIVLKINQLKEKCPFLDVEKEIELCRIL